MLPLSQARLYGIVDLGYVKPENVVTITQQLLAGGIDILQLRAKSAQLQQVIDLGQAMHEQTLAAGIPLVINDHPLAAAKIQSEGVHVGQDDDAVARARDIVGAGCFVGKSTHSLAQAEAAQAEGADYIGFGPLFATGTKPDYVPIGLQDIKTVHERVQVPIFCIGGVNAERLGLILAAGAKRVVVVSTFLTAKAPPKEVTNYKLRLFT
jgi:thiamine-phosphate pyrophosphorylase